MAGDRRLDTVSDLLDRAATLLRQEAEEARVKAVLAPPVAKSFRVHSRKDEAPEGTHRRTGTHRREDDPC